MPINRNGKPVSLFLFFTQIHLKYGEILRWTRLTEKQRCGIYLINKKQSWALGKSMMMKVHCESLWTSTDTEERNLNWHENYILFYKTMQTLTIFKVFLNLDNILTSFQIKQLPNDWRGCWFLSFYYITKADQLLLPILGQLKFKWIF